MLKGFVFTKGKTRSEDNAAAALSCLKEEGCTVWFDFEDPSESEIEMLIDEFNFHPLSIEDAIFPQDHPKLEEFEDYVFITLHGIQYSDIINSQELNIFFGKNYVITFHETKLTSISRLMNRALKLSSNDIDSGRYHDFSKGSDLLLHAVIDGLVDEYFPTIEKLEVRMSQLEDRVLEEKDANLLDDTLKLKRNILILRKFISLERAVIGKLCKGDVQFIRKSAKMYFNDVFDHIFSMQEDIEILREVIPSFIESYWSMHSKKLNKSIHRLTMLATIAMPMIAITSYYGMNLALPEIKWGMTGVFFMWGITAASTIATYLLLKWKKWL
jgi:magnesium transporter